MNWESAGPKLAPCQSCEKEYRRDKLKQCPSCGIHNDGLLPSVTSSSRSSQAIVNSSFSVADPAQAQAYDFKKLIAAQDRTTHAVRAIVLFLFIQLSCSSLAYVVWNLSMAFSEPSSFLQFVAVFTWIVGIVWSSSVGWSEIQESEIH